VGLPGNTFWASQIPPCHICIKAVIAQRERLSTCLRQLGSQL